MKTIDKLLVKSFIPPFVGAFVISLFVLFMQYMWKAVEHIVGKGVETSVLAEFMFYLSIWLIPTALPLSVLIAAVMTMGNMAEKYELTSLKSAGVSLGRAMMPLFVVCVGITIFSFVTINNLAPVASLKFKSRMFDMKRQKPTLSLEKQTFNYDFQGFVIRIADKDVEQEGDMRDVLIYNHGQRNRRELTSTTAESGNMQMTPDDKFLVMELYDGHQYQQRPDKNRAEPTYPFVRTNFKTWRKVFDMSEFEMDLTDEQVFRNDKSMLSVRQLLGALDSIDRSIGNRRSSTARYMEPYLHFVKQNRDSNRYYIPSQQYAPTADSYLVGKGVSERRRAARLKLNESRPAKKLAKPSAVPLNASPRKPSTAALTGANTMRVPNRDIEERPGIVGRFDLVPLTDIPEDVITAFPATRRSALVDRATSMARSIKSQTDTALRTLAEKKQTRRKFENEYYLKFSMSLACLVLLFVGAPMGAIIRKGGFGYPILVSIIFFIVFILLLTVGKKLSENYVLSAFTGMFLPHIVLGPLGGYITWRAIKDAKILDIGSYFAFLQRWINGDKKEKEDTAAA